MSDLLNRTLKLLQIIPILPLKKSPQMLEAELNKAGFKISERTIQRDLHKLSDKNGFPLVCDNRDKPHGWSWIKEAPIYNLPSMDKNTALSFYLSKQFLDKLLPPSIVKYLAPNFKLAAAILDDKKENVLETWRHKVRVLSRAQALTPPDINNNTLDVVYQCLLEAKKFNVAYKPKLKESKIYKVSPLGIVVRDELIYLVATLWDYEEPIQLLLNRMEHAEPLAEPITNIDFNLDDYIASGELDYLIEKDDIQLKFKANDKASFAIIETPLSTDQTNEEQSDGSHIITATVKDTRQLRWWLLSYGQYIEVIEPQYLRYVMVNTAINMLENYHHSGAKW